MRIVLKEQGRTFATRSRGEQTATSLVQRASGGSLEVDFTDVYASPSFISQFLSGVGTSFDHIRIIGANAHTAGVAARAVERQGLTDKVTIDDPVPA